MPPPTRRWPRTSRRARSPRRAGCASTSTPAPGSSTGWWSGPSAGASARSSSARPATTAGPSGTPSPASAGSRSTTPRPSGTSGTGWPGSASRPPPGAVRRGRFHPRPGRGRLPAAGLDPAARPVPAGRGGGLPGTRRPGARPAPVPPGRRRAAAWPSACRCPAPRRGQVPLPGRGRRRGRAGQVHARRRRGHRLLARTGWRVMASRRRRRRSGGRGPARAAAARPACSLASAAAPPATDPRPAPSRRRAPKPAPANRRAGLSPCPSSPTEPLSLSALLSQALVAFTIELDNEAEHRLPHHTTDSAPGAKATVPGWYHGPCGELPAVRRRRVHNRGQTSDPRPHPDQSGWHAPLGLYHDRRNGQQGT